MAQACGNAAVQQKSKDAPAHYHMEFPPAGHDLAVGDQVIVTSGSLEGMTGVVRRVKKTTVDLSVRLFGQDLAMEVPAETVCKVEAA